MIRIYLILCMLTVIIIRPSFAQIKKDSAVITGDAARKIMSEIKFDTLKFLSEYSLRACQCIDSFLQVRKANDDTKPLDDIKHCINGQVIGYQAVMKIYQSFQTPEKDIVLNTNENSDDHKRYYRDIEHWLMDSCPVLKIMIGSTDKEETELSFSNNPEAVKQYNLGIGYYTKENYLEALPCFKKATEADPKFVFAWDNLGICYRRTGDLDNALAAYTKSLELSPRGRIPLQNIPVVHELKKEYAKALDGYKRLLQYFPGDAEAYYGMGRICILFTGDFDTGVDYMCKAYNLYTKEKSPYRVDAQENLSYAYQKMKEQGKEELFFKILKDNNISVK